MKKLIISVIFAMASFLGTSQVVTINIFQTQDLTSLDSTISVQEVIDNPDFFSDFEMVTDNLRYVIDITNNTCEVSRDGYEINSFNIEVISKKSDRDFKIQFITPGDVTTYGLVVNNDIAACFDKFRVINITNFTSFFIN
jgi:hypothetical protein